MTNSNQHFHNSSVRMSGLQAIEKLLETPKLKLKKPEIQGGSHMTLPVKLWSKCFHHFAPACLGRLRRGDALAVQCCEKVQLSSLYMMCDILPTVTHLSCASCIDVSQFHLLVTSTIEAIMHIHGQTPWTLTYETRVQL